MADQGRYIAVAHNGSPYFTLLNHTTPGSVSLAATTVAGKEVYLGCIYNSASSKWEVVAVAQE